MLKGILNRRVLVMLRALGCRRQFQQCGNFNAGVKQRKQTRFCKVTCAWWGDNLVRRTKIVCTIGPASVWSRCAAVGANGCSSAIFPGDHVIHKRRINTLRAVSKQLGRSLAIMLDTKGRSSSGYFRRRTGYP